jgi:hypothetical protein
MTANWEAQDQASVAAKTLVFDDEFFAALRDTDITLRKGSLSVVTGEFNFVAAQSSEVLPVEITAIQEAPFKDLPDAVFERDGKGGRDQSFRDMSSFYPDMTPETIVTALSYQILEP